MMTPNSNINYDWNAYLRKMEPHIRYFKYTIKDRTGHEPTDAEVWAYLGWCADLMLQHIYGGVESDALPMIRDVADWVSQRCSDNYRATITGKYDPPSTKRYESPQAFESAKTDMMAQMAGGATNVSPETNKYQAGYL